MEAATVWIEGKELSGCDETLSMTLEWECGGQAQFFISSSLRLACDVLLYTKEGSIKVLPRCSFSSPPEATWSLFRRFRITSGALRTWR